MPRRSLVFAAVLLAAAIMTRCGDGSLDLDASTDAGPAPTDAAPAAIEVLLPVEPTLPTAAALPVLTPCAPGWRERAPQAEGMPATCDPWAERGRSTCEDDGPQLPGDPGCTPLGAPCPVGQFAEGLPTDRSILYVLPGSPAPNTGTIDAPFATVAAAIAAGRNTPGVIIALAKGEYAETPRVRDDMTLWGACVRETRILGLAGSSASLELAGRGVTVRELSITGASDGIVAGNAATEARVESVLIYDAGHTGVLVTGSATVALARVAVVRSRELGIGAFDTSRVSLDRVAIEKTGWIALGISNTNHTTVADSVISDVGLYFPRPDESTSVFVDRRGLLDMRRSVVEHGAWKGIGVVSGRAELRDVVIRDIRDTDDGDGISVLSPGLVRVERASIEENAFIGASAVEAGSELELEDVVITQAGIAGRGNDGLLVGDGALLRATRLAVFHTWEAAIGIYATGARAVLEDVHVLETQEDPADDSGGLGLAVLEGGTVELKRGRFARNHGRAIVVFASPEESVLEDVTVEDTSSVHALHGEGLLVYEGSRVVLRRASFDRCGAGGIDVYRPGSTLIAADITVRDMRGADVPASLPGFDGHFGQAFTTGDGASVEVERMRIERSRQMGVFLYNSTASFQDLTVLDTATDSNGQFGRGLSVAGSTVSGARILVSGNHDVAIGAGAGGALTLRDVTVIDTATARCLPAICGEEITEAGIGISSVDGKVDIRNFYVKGNALCGVQVAENGALDLEDGTVELNAIGAHIGRADYDVNRITKNVLYQNNGKNFDGEARYVPSFTLPPLE